MLVHLKLLIFTLFSILFLTACEDKQVVQEEQIEVGTITLKEQSVALQQELSGRIKAKLTSEVRPQIDGIVKDRLFVEGSFVKQGAVLYKIDDETYKATFNQAKASLDSAKADLQTAKLKSERYDELLKVDGISKQETDDAKALYLQAKALVEEKIAALESAKIDLERTQIKAPISGYISISNVTKGALVQANQADALTTIRDNSSVYVDLSQSQNDLLLLRKLLQKESIKKGSAEVSLVLSDNSIYPHKGVLQLQEISVDESTATVTLRAEFPNGEGVLLPGMFVKATIEGAIDTKAFLVPQQAVTRDSKANPLVTIVQTDNSIKTQQITIQRAVDNTWLVTSGVTSNDKIIIEGLNKINPKSIVKPVDVTSKYIKD